MRTIFLMLLITVLISCEDIITIPDISGENVKILAPTDTATLTIASVNFSWNSVEEAETYKLQIAEPSFVSATQIVLDTTITATNFTKVLAANNYQWRVRAENSGYHTAYVTQSFSVDLSNTEDISNEQVSLLAPANAASFANTDAINFSWESVANADSYTIQIAQPDFANAVETIEDVTQTETTFSVSNLAINDYEWRVKALNANFETDYTTQSFVVE